MTNLSPAAQAVLDAATEGFWQTSLNSEGNGAAAALRAAADQIEDLYCESDVDSADGVVFAMRQLVLIAAELGPLDD